MSRSYKHTPSWRSSEDSKKGKRRANRRVRYASGVGNGKHYRKFYEPWDIVDCRNLAYGFSDSGTEHYSDTILTLDKARELLKSMSIRYRNGEHDLRTDIHYLIDAISK